MNMVLCGELSNILHADSSDSDSERDHRKNMRHHMNLDTSIPAMNKFQYSLDESQDALDSIEKFISSPCHMDDDSTEGNLQKNAGRSLQSSGSVATKDNSIQSALFDDATKTSSSQSAYTWSDKEARQNENQTSSRSKTSKISVNYGENKAKKPCKDESSFIRNDALQQQQQHDFGFSTERNDEDIQMRDSHQTGKFLPDIAPLSPSAILQNLRNHNSHVMLQNVNSDSSSVKDHSSVLSDAQIEKHLRKLRKQIFKYCPTCSCRLTYLYTSSKTRQLTEIHGGTDSPRAKAIHALPPYCIGCRAYLVFDWLKEDSRKLLLNNLEKKFYSELSSESSEGNNGRAWGHGNIGEPFYSNEHINAKIVVVGLPFDVNSEEKVLLQIARSLSKELCQLNFDALCSNSSISDKEFYCNSGSGSGEDEIIQNHTFPADCFDAALKHPEKSTGSQQCIMDASLQHSETCDLKRLNKSDTYVRAELEYNEQRQDNEDIHSKYESEGKNIDLDARDDYPDCNLSSDINYTKKYKHSDYVVHQMKNCGMDVTVNFNDSTNVIDGRNSFYDSNVIPESERDVINSLSYVSSEKSVGSKTSDRFVTACTYSEERALLQHYSFKKEEATKQISKRLQIGYDLTTAKCIRCGMPKMKKGDEILCVSCPAIIKKAKRIAREKRNLATPKISNKLFRSGFPDEGQMYTAKETLKEKIMGNDFNAEDHNPKLPINSCILPDDRKLFSDTEHSGAPEGASVHELFLTNNSEQYERQYFPEGFQHHTHGSEINSSSVRNNSIKNRSLDPYYQQMYQQGFYVTSSQPTDESIYNSQMPTHLSNNYSQIHSTVDSGIAHQNIVPEHTFLHKGVNPHPSLYHHSDGIDMIESDLNPPPCNSINNESIVSETRCPRNLPSSEMVWHYDSSCNIEKPSLSYKYSGQTFDEGEPMQTGGPTDRQECMNINEMILQSDTANVIRENNGELKAKNLEHKNSEYNGWHASDVHLDNFHEQRSHQKSESPEYHHMKHLNFKDMGDNGHSGQQTSQIDHRWSDSPQQNMTKNKFLVSQTIDAHMFPQINTRKNLGANAEISWRRNDLVRLEICGDQQLSHLELNQIPLSYDRTAFAPERETKVNYCESKAVNEFRYVSQPDEGQDILLYDKNFNEDNDENLLPSAWKECTSLSEENKKLHDRIAKLALSLKQAAGQFQRKSVSQDEDMTCNMTRNHTHSKGASPLIDTGHPLNDEPQNQGSLPFPSVAQSPSFANYQHIAFPCPKEKAKMHRYQAGNDLYNSLKISSTDYAYMRKIELPDKNESQYINKSILISPISTNRKKTCAQNYNLIDNMQSPDTFHRQKSPTVHNKCGADPPGQRFDSNQQTIRHAESHNTKSNRSDRSHSDSLNCSVNKGKILSLQQSKNNSTLKPPSANTGNAEFELNIPSWVDEEIGAPIKGVNSWGESSMDQLFRKIDEIENDFSTIVASIPGSGELSLRNEDDCTQFSRISHRNEQNSRPGHHDRVDSSSFESNESHEKLVSNIIHQMRQVQDQIEQLDSAEVDDNSEEEYQSQGEMAVLIERLAIAAESLRSLQVA